MKVVILCGGKGIRSFPFTHYMPKPMLPIGGIPIVVHVIKSFIQQGYNEFVLSAGYRQSILRDYFDNKQFAAKIDIVDSGEEADTGERVLRCREYLNDRFMVTYADGLCDVPLARLIEFHILHQALATITCVPMRSQYGILQIDSEGRVEQIQEKPLMKEWVNAGYIVFERDALDDFKGQSLERDVLPNLTARNVVYAYRHHGFFKSVDSYKDMMEFEELMETGETPWIVRS
jgi:glucose-1-phosphate cytidylyltransferase